MEIYLLLHVAARLIMAALILALAPPPGSIKTQIRLYEDLIEPLLRL
jgi:hypothetical protein